MAYWDIRINVIDLTGNIHNIEDSHIGMNRRKNYYHTLIDFMIFMLTNSPDFLVFCKKKASHLQDIQPQRIITAINLNIHAKSVWIILP